MSFETLSAAGEPRRHECAEASARGGSHLKAGSFLSLVAVGRGLKSGRAV